MGEVFFEGNVDADGKANGVNMWKELLQLEATLGVHEESRDHDRELEALRDAPLADNCAVNLFTTKVNLILNEHVPHLERPLTGEALSKFIIKLMPATNASEGRDIRRRLALAGTLGNSSLVITERARGRGADQL